MLMIFISLDGCVITAPLPQSVQYTNPAWAPDYYQGVRYYYFPDIEAYYDLSNQSFVYLSNGQWTESYNLPPAYSNFNLYGAYVVGVNVHVYQPWVHNEYYVAHYPRYYYRNTYKGHDRENIRGFNENIRKPFVRTPEARNHFNEGRRQENEPNTIDNSRPADKPIYYGRRVGKPVKVKPQMRENRQANPATVKPQTRENRKANPVTVKPQTRENKQTNKEAKTTRRRRQ